MTKSDLIEKIGNELNDLLLKDIEAGVKIILETMVDSLAQDQRIEVRGFGSFSIHRRNPRTARNPKTGEKVILPVKYNPHFKPGKELKERVNKR